MNSINPDHAEALAAQSRVISEVLNILQLRWDDSCPSAHLCDALQYGEEQLALAARDLVRATDRLPDNAKPVGWGDGQEKRDRELIARHLRSAGSAVNIVDWPAYLRVCADAHDAGEAWYRP